MKKKWMIPVCVLAVLVLLGGIGICWLRAGNVLISIKDTGSYREADIRACMEQVKERYADGTSETLLLRLSYAPEYGEQYGDGEAIVIHADFLTGRESGPLNPYDIYLGYGWIFRQEAGGAWVLKDSGYA